MHKAGKEDWKIKAIKKDYEEQFNKMQSYAWERIN